MGEQEEDKCIFCESKEITPDCHYMQPVCERCRGLVSFVIIQREDRNAKRQT